MRILWDPAKSESNRKKHGVSFQEAATLLSRQDECLGIYDTEHSDAEDRFHVLGALERGVVLVVYAEPEDDVFRLISARMATRREERRFLAYVRWRK